MPKRSRSEKPSAKAESRMKYDRDALLNLFSKANRARIMRKSYDLYCQILETPHLNEYLEGKLIADVYFNRALKNLDIAIKHQGEHGFTSAATHIVESLEDMNQAKAMYLADGRTDDADICSDQIKLIQAKLDEIIAELTENTAKIPVLASPSFFKGHGGTLVPQPESDDAEASESNATAGPTPGRATSTS